MLSLGKNILLLIIMCLALKLINLLHQECADVACSLSIKSRPQTTQGLSADVKGPILCCFSSFSHSRQRSNSSVFDMHCPKPIRGPEFQLSKSRSTELYSEQSVSVPAPLNANELRLLTPTWRALPASHSQGEDAPCVSSSMR